MRYVRRVEPRSIREDRLTVSEAHEVRLLCPHCSSPVFAKWEYPWTPERRQQAIKLAIEEHRRLCSGAPPEAGRVYEITYPRA